MADNRRMEDILRQGQQQGPRDEEQQRQPGGNPAGDPTGEPTAQPTQPESTGNRNQNPQNDSENVDPRPENRMGDIMDAERSRPPDGSSDGPDVAGSTGRGIGAAAGNMVALGAALTAANKALDGLTNTVLRANAGLAEYNGQIAAAVGQAEARGIGRAAQTGAEIGDEYARMNNASQEYQDMMTDIKAPLMSAGMEIQAAILEVRNWALSYISEPLASMTEGVDDIVDWLFSREETDDISTATAGRAFLSDVRDGKFDGNGTGYMNPGNRPLMSDADRTRIFGP